MDPLAHTLVGASMAETGLRHRSRFATVALIIGANAPDIDAFATLAGPDAMYGFRRGWTHGPVGMALLPVLMTGLLWAIDRWRPRKDDGPPVRPRALLAISYLAVLSHPALDWLNNYGVRLLMPFDGRWFYGDAIFIIDPWMWLSMAAAVVLARTGSPMGIVTWLVVGIATTGLVMWAPFVPMVIKGMWVAVVALIVIARLRPNVVKRSALVARTALATLAVYIALNLVGSAIARGQARDWLASRDVETTHVMAGPLPANPFLRDVIAFDGNRYHFVEVDWLAEETLKTSHEPIPMNDGPIARAARGIPELAGFSNWLRFPSYEVIERPDGHRVWIRDVRYSRIGASIGTARIDLDSNLKPTDVDISD